MSDACATPPAAPGADKVYRRVLWAVLAINAVGFAVELGAGLLSGSLALQADALDFLGDAANYAIALFVLARSLAWRASAALAKGVAMAGFGVWVLGAAIYNAFVLGLPSAGIMGTVGLFALLANLASAALLYRHREGDSNRRAVWLCTRNDALGNIAVLVAAGAVATTATRWPDLAVAVIMAGLALGAGLAVIRQARAELRPALAV